MALFDRVETLETKVAQAETDIATLKAAPAADTTALTALEATVAALRADVGTPAVVV